MEGIDMHIDQSQAGPSDQSEQSSLKIIIEQIIFNIVEKRANAEIYVMDSCKSVIRN